MVPLWLSWEKETQLKKIIFTGWLTQFIFTLIGGFWVANVAYEHGHLPYPVAVIALLLFCAFAAYYLPLAGFLWFQLRKKLNFSPMSSFAVLALITAILERFTPTIFPWNFGYSFLWSKTPLFQLAEYVGFTGISALCILSNVYFIYIWKARKFKFGLIAFGIFFTILNILGIFTASNLAPFDKKSRVLIVQANIGNLEKEYAQRGHGFVNHIINKYISVSKKALSSNKNDDPVDFMVWPETAIPINIKVNGSSDSRQRKIEGFLKNNNLPLFSGGYYKNPESRRISNAFFVFDDQGKVKSTPYRKHQLLAFGEYLPFSQAFPILLKWFPGVAGFEAGEKSHVLKYKDYTLGPQICYESLFPRFSQALAKGKAQFIINLTNDSWYGPYSEPYQHQYITLARAIEFRRPVIRSTNTGISTVMLANGKLLNTSPIFKEWSHIFEVDYHKTPKTTLYEKYFYLVESILVILLCIFLFLGLKKADD